MNKVLILLLLTLTSCTTMSYKRGDRVLENVKCEAYVDSVRDINHVDILYICGPMMFQFTTSMEQLFYFEHNYVDTLRTEYNSVYFL